MSKAEREGSPAPSSLEIHLLGPFRVRVDGRTVEERHWSRRKPKQLVKLLALQPHHQLHREQAMELLWPDVELEAAANNMHKAIHLARHALEPALKSVADSHFILTQDQQILLRAPGQLWIDVDAFERQAAQAGQSAEAGAYEATLSLYAGDLLIEDLYEDWAATRREQLRGLHQGLLAGLARTYEAQGLYRQSIERLKELLGTDPANEEVHRDLMRLYASTGNRRQALRQYRQCAEALRRELEAEPNRATTELHRQIESGRLQPPPPGAVAAQPERDQAAIESIAILPLTNLSADPNMEYFSDGITESIINSLSQLPGLRVMAWGTVARYKGRENAAGEVGRDLRVRAVMMGRALEVGERLVVKAELVDVSDGSQLWGAQYNRDASDIFAVQEEIAREISAKLRLKLTSEEQKQLAKRHTVSAAAYRLYLKGRYFWYKRTEEALRKGIEFFNQAIEEDPSYAAAYDGLSDSYALLALRELAPPKEAFRKAKAAARKALEIDDTLGEAYASLAHIRLHDWDWPGLEGEFKRAIQLKPGHSIAYHWYAEYLMAMGRADESIALMKQALEIDPLSPIINSALADAFYLARKYDQAIKQLLEGLEVNPNHLMLHFRLGHAYLQKGMYEEAVAEIQKAVTLSGRSTETLAGLGQAYAQTGRREEVRQVLDELSGSERYVCPHHVAKVYTALGDNEQAFHWLEKAYEEHSPDLIDLNLEPALDPLRPDPRFADLLRRVGLV